MLDLTLEIIIAPLALFVSALSFVYSLYNHYWIKKIDVRDLYLEMERTSEELFTLPIEKDYLNKLYYTKEPPDFPEENTPLDDMTTEQRAIYNFAVLQLNYFEQIVILNKNKMLPKGVKDVWTIWLKECVQSPYFMWARHSLSKHYRPELDALINEYSNGSDIANLGWKQKIMKFVSK